jgi:hypothetical protein
MDTLILLIFTVVFLGAGIVLVLYEISRIKAGRPILKAGVAAQSYYILYFAMFVLALVTAIKAVTVIS